MTRSTKSSQVTVMEDTSLDRVYAAGVSRLFTLAPPWVAEGISVAGAGVFHAYWGDSMWWAVGLLPPTGLLTALAWKLSHHRSSLRRMHATATTAVTGVWFAAATSVGPFEGHAMSYFTVVGSVTTALTWNMAYAIRQQGGEGRGDDALRELFGEKADVVGLPGSKMHTIKATAHKVLAKLVTPSGTRTLEDMQRKRGNIEAALQLPAGSVSVALDEDRADHAQVTITDPRVMKNPIPWPGPSRPGESIAEPVRIGLYQDADDALYTVLEHHLLTMGMSGSGKSFGGLWSLLAEVITRCDVAVWAADITKKTQTLGALAPALDWFVTSKKDAMAMLDAVQAIIAPRTDYLASKRLKGWEPGCGLTFLVVVLEEASDILAAMTDKQLDRFVSTMRAARSAGIFIDASLQRAIWNQLDTNARAQFAGAMCFGVQNDKDAGFGLPDHVLEAGATPERWQSNRPGTCYLSAPGVPEEKLAIPVKTFFFEDAQMRAHALANPASARPLDEATMRAAGQAYAQRTAPSDIAGDDTPETVTTAAMADDAAHTEDEDVTSTTEEYQTTPDPDPSIQATMDDEIGEPPFTDEEEENFAFVRPAEKMTPAEALDEVLAQLSDWAETGREHFETRDLRPVLDRTGYSRAWALKQIKKLVEDEVLEHGEDGGYTILKTPAMA
jgi:hypothetical protein